MEYSSGLDLPGIGLLVLGNLCVVFIIQPVWLFEQGIDTGISILGSQLKEYLGISWICDLAGESISLRTGLRQCILILFPAHSLCFLLIFEDINIQLRAPSTISATCYHALLP